MQNNNQDEDEELQQGAETIVSPQSGTVQSSPVNSSPGGTAAKPVKRGSGWTNLQDYVRANQGQDARMAGDVESRVSSERSSADQAATQFNTAARGSIDQNTVQDTTSKSLSSDPTQVSAADFTKQYNASYEGPNSASDVEGFGDVANQVNQFQQKTNQAGDFYGRQNLLSDLYGNKDGQSVKYTRGEKNLDSFLLGAGDAGKKSMEDIVNANKNYQQDFNKNYRDAIDSYAGQAKAKTDQTRNAVQSAYSSALGGLDTTLGRYKTQLSDESGKLDADYKAMIDALIGNDIDAKTSQLKSMGTDEQALQHLLARGYDVSDLIQKGGYHNLSDFASPEEIARYNALASLGNQVGVSAQYADEAGEKASGNTAKISYNQDLIKSANEVIAAQRAADEARQAKAAAENPFVATGGITGMTADIKPYVNSGLSVEQATQKKAVDDAASTAFANSGGFSGMTPGRIAELERGDSAPVASGGNGRGDAGWGPLKKKLKENQIR